MRGCSIHEGDVFYVHESVFIQLDARVAPEEIMSRKLISHKC